LQCPFLFFARRTLELKGPEIAPEKRLDANVQGEIVHEVLARWVRTREEIGPVLEEVFRRTCAREGIPGGYRTEAIRLELLRNLRRFVARAGAAAAGEVETEQDLALTLDGGVSLRCRIDRIDAMPDGRALIIDYKYSSPERTRKLVKQHAEGTRIQGGIYMLAVRDSGRQIAGMLFAGLRKASAWEGWDTRKEGVTQGELHQVMEQSRHTALQAIQRIQEGRIAPKPADTEICQYCAYRDVCRVEAVAGVVAAGEAEE
jgi:ATP-dependent helicase/DNAse subunit B